MGKSRNVRRRCANVALIKAAQDGVRVQSYSPTALLFPLPQLRKRCLRRARPCTICSNPGSQGADVHTCPVHRQCATWSACTVTHAVPMAVPWNAILLISLQTHLAESVQTVDDHEHCPCLMSSRRQALLLTTKRTVALLCNLRYHLWDT
jgi:hypothetical protein